MTLNVYERNEGHETKMKYDVLMEIIFFFHFLFSSFCI